jgi:AraC-like DNA-binding protein
MDEARQRRLRACFENQLADFRIDKAVHSKPLAAADVLWQPRGMTLLLTLDLLARGGSLSLLLLWSSFLLRDHRQALAARIAICMNLTIACHIVASIPGSIGHGSFDTVFEIGAGLVPGFFWLFARTWFNDEMRIGWRSWALLAIAALNVLIIIQTYPARQTPFFIAVTLMRIMMFGFGIAGLWVAWKGREGDLVESRRRFRIAMIWTVGAFVILTNAVEVLANNDVIPNLSRNLIEAGILLLSFAFCYAMFAIRDDDLFAGANTKIPDQTPDREPDGEIYAPLVSKLTTFMQSEMAWRDEGLSISKLATLLGEQEYRLRRVINGQMGHRNFAAFLNGYRLAEVRQALTDPSQKEVPIITIALDAGFGSLGPFNRAFREAEGMTPSEYRNHAG